MMHRSWFAASRAAVLAVFALAVAACAPAPIYKAGPASIATTPAEALASAATLKGRHVVWGGTVVSVQNLPTTSVIQVLAYPLDASQRPRLKQPPTGRFLAEVQGFVEPLNYPVGAPITLEGALDGTRHDKIGQADYDFPLVRSGGVHRWTPEEMAKGHPNFSFGVGVGAGSW